MVRWRSESDVQQQLSGPDRCGWGAEPPARSRAAAHAPRWRGSAFGIRDQAAEQVRGASLPSCSCAPAARRHPCSCRTGFGVGSWSLHRNGWGWSRRRSLLEGSLGPCGLHGSGVFPGCGRLRIRLGRLGFAHYLHSFTEHDRDQFSLVRLADRDPSSLQAPFKPPPSWTA
jgi:hypothetical protein